MKTVICYYSCHHGNTRKVVEAMAEEGGAALVDLSTQPEAALEEYDLIGFASGIYDFSFHPSVVQFARERLPRGKRVFCVCTYGGAKGMGAKEIVRAAQKLAERVAAGAMKPEEIDRAAFEGELYTAGLPDVDLLIRTSGEMRLSNFLLYQLAYAEFYQTDTLWPDFDRHAYDEALLAFAKRNRRFGGV